MGMSLARKTSTADRAAYQGYLSSTPWKARRRRYFETVKAAGFEPACQVCFATLAELGVLDLHHVSYDGVKEVAPGRFRAQEKDEDLVPLCRDHHEQLHRTFDQHRLTYWGWDRKRATVVVINYMRKALKEQKGRKTN